jgi:hypothetical protein
MRNFKLFTMIASIMATVCFTACDNDNDKKHEANACEPAACEMAEHATEMGCDDAGHCIVKACADTFKVAEDAKSCEADAHACTCDPACKDNEDCIKGEGDKCECREKDKPAACDPACEDGKTKCECTNDACACVPVTPAPACEPACPEGKECKCVEDKCDCADVNPPASTCSPVCDEATQDCVCEADKCECIDKNGAEPEDPCKDKAENADCDENKTCRKGEGDKLECKDKPAEPTQPDKPE